MWKYAFMPEIYHVELCLHARNMFGNSHRPDVELCFHARMFGKIIAPVWHYVIMPEICLEIITAPMWNYVFMPETCLKMIPATLRIYNSIPPSGHVWGAALDFLK